MSTDNGSSGELPAESAAVSAPQLASGAGSAPQPQQSVMGRILSSLLRWDGWTKVAAIATALTAVAALWFSAQSLQSTRDQYGLSAQGQVTERFTNAVENLGSEKINVRLGGIYSLERLAKDSTEDQPTIIEILSGFIRTQAPADVPECTLPKLVRDDSAPRGWRYVGPLPQTAIDVQAALTVLGRRNVDHDAGALPDLTGTCLAEAHLTGSFAGADFDGAKMPEAHFDGTDLRCATFGRTELATATFWARDLRWADFSSAHATGVEFNSSDHRGANMRGANLTSAVLNKANLMLADLTGADLSDADLTDAWLRIRQPTGVELGRPNLTGAYYTPQTRWPAGFDPPASADGVVSHFLDAARCLRERPR
ncbi:pentapeptide repeat-containing protein [Nocardia sp. NPDC058379]|uniref:pentapeptide repeat-containing protein n=1 Tax=unclassified Nocardia TaxID=2637762 RepID=UPI003654FDDA